MSPFGYVSQIHYLRLTDISWSPDGSFLVVTSTDGFSSFIVFDKDELGKPYTGELMPVEELDPASVKEPKVSLKQQNKQQAELNKSVSLLSGSAEKKKPKLAKVPIATYFDKSSPSASPSPLSSPGDVKVVPNQAKPAPPPTVGRRVSLLTLFSSKATKPGGGSPKLSETFETGVKRKFDGDPVVPSNDEVIQID